MTSIKHDGIKGFAEALEAIPITLLENAGLNGNNVISDIKQLQINEKRVTWELSVQGRRIGI